MNCLDFRPQHSCQYSQVKQSENSGLHVRALHKLLMNFSRLYFATVKLWLDCLKSAFCLKIRLVLNSDIAIANHDFMLQ